MAYTFIHRKDVEYQNLLTALRDDLISLGGWATHDENTNDLVMKMNTSEGVGNEIYVRFYHQSNNVNNQWIHVHQGTGWDAVNNTWATGAKLVLGTWHHFGQAANTPAQLCSYYLSGDSDHMIWGVWANANSWRAAPVYAGLLDKYHPKSIDPGTQASVVLTRHAENTSGATAYTDVYNRVGILKGWSGEGNAYGRMMKETMFHNNRDFHEYVRFGPWGPDKRIFSGMAPIYETGWGLRGYLKNVRVVPGATNTTLNIGDTVDINGVTYYWWRSHDTAVHVSQYSGWNLYLNATNGLNHGLLIRKTPS